MLCTGLDIAGALLAFWVPSFKEYTEYVKGVPARERVEIMSYEE